MKYEKCEQVDAIIMQLEAECACLRSANMDLRKQLTDQCSRDRLETARVIVAGMLSNPARNYNFEGCAIDALRYTNALLAELDKFEAPAIQTGEIPKPHDLLGLYKETPDGN